MPPIVSILCDQGSVRLLIKAHSPQGGRELIVRLRKKLIWLPMDPLNLNSGIWPSFGIDLLLHKAKEKKVTLFGPTIFSIIQSTDSNKNPFLRIDLLPPFLFLRLLRTRFFR